MMPLFSFLGAALPWFSKALFSNKTHDGLFKQLEELAHNLVPGKSNDAFHHLLSDPKMLLTFQKHAFSLQQEYVKNVCQDRIHARKRDMLCVAKNGNNHRADRMIYIACIGLLACILALWICRQALSVELVSIISAIIGVFGSCLKDAYVFEFGSGKLHLANNKAFQRQIDAVDSEDI